MICTGLPATGDGQGNVLSFIIVKRYYFVNVMCAGEIPKDEVETGDNLVI